ncbi:MAG TPA: hypothetical protein VK620_23845 [Bradyrhizobium sp.]|nr:hypothetical protein [Bradyrhizobium sp.]
MSINTGLVILAFGAAWLAFLRGLTALGRMLMLTFPYLDPSPNPICGTRHHPPQLVECV